METSFRDRPK